MPSKGKRKKPNRRRSSNEFGEQQPVVMVPPRRDRDRMVAMVLASLFAGFLFVVNADRVTHVQRDSEPGVSQHGWPLVYLKRTIAEPPMFIIENNVYSWPWPAQEGETRDANFANLAIDLALIVVAAIAVYWIIKSVVGRYDRWRWG